MNQTLYLFMSQFQDGLKAEIAFWRELISSSKLSLHSPQCRRMERSLQLAQERLASYEKQKLNKETAKKES